jgi:hypothetical protein
MKNKKGFFLAEETLKIVIAVIVIIFLVYFLASLYFSGRDSQDMKFAESSVNYIIGQMNSNIREIQVFNPEGWMITAWTKGKDMPLQCSNLDWKNCICICGISHKYLVFGKTALENCDTEAYCAQYGKEIFIKDESINIDNAPITLEINYGDKIEVSEK